MQSIIRPARTAAVLAFTFAFIPISAALAATPDLLVFDFAGMLPGPNLKVQARLQNAHNQPLSPTVVIYRGSVRDGSAVEIYRATPTIAAFGGVRVETTPMTLPEGQKYSVCVDPENAIAESNENNNCDVQTVSAVTTDLAVQTVDIAMSPIGADVGEPVKVNAVVRNLKTVASNALVRLFQGHPESPAAKVLGQTSLTVPGSGSSLASWTIVRPAGDSNFFVSVDDVLPRDSSQQNNVASRNVYLKAVVDTGRMAGPYSRYATFPTVGDLLGTGQPVMAFTEHTGSAADNPRLTVIQVMTDGTFKELWSKVLAPAPAAALSPSMADLDGDGSPEIVVEVVQRTDINAGKRDGAINIMAFDKNGNVKWQHPWQTPGRSPCHANQGMLTPVLGDMNKDGVADVVVIEKELVILDGRNGAELVRNSNLPDNANWCTSAGYATIADLDGDGSNEFILGKFGIFVFNADGSSRWKGEANNIYHFALVDVDKDGAPELILPVHRQRFDILDARTGKLKKRSVPSPWSPFDDTIAVTTSVDPSGHPTIVIANNDATNGTGVLDNQLNVKWWKSTPLPNGGSSIDNPQHVVLADLLGQGRPQVISRSDRRSFGIQDITTGSWLLYTDIFGFGAISGWPIPVDVDGDGRGEIIVNYGTSGGDEKLPYEAQLPTSSFLIFGSDHWKKLPTTWNQTFFVPNQVDRKLAFRHDYVPYKTHNTWFQQPLRAACDLDFDDDVDQNDVNLIFTARGQQIQPGDFRDIDKDGAITVQDARACTLKCTKPNCTAINQEGRVLSVNPRSAFPGSTATVTIRGEFLGFRAGQTIASFGPGVSVDGRPAGEFGPVTVLDTETAVAIVSIQPGQTGERTVSIRTGTLSGSRTDAFALSAGNLPPVVKAGSDQRLVLPGSITLSGNVTDDGLPNAKLTWTWQVIGGPGTVMFADPNALNTSATFSNDGFYHLRLSATDGQYFASDDLGVTVIAGNQAPYVSAGPDLTARAESELQLNGDVQDDGLPAFATVTAQWSKVSGPGAVTFAAATSVVTKASFATAGTYVLKLTANDTDQSASDEVQVTVAPSLAEVLTITPASAAPGQGRKITIKTKNTNFVSGLTEASFGPGVAVGGAAAGSFGVVTVLDDTTAEAQVTVVGGASLGSRTVSIRTADQQATKTEGFAVGTIGQPFAIDLNLTDVAVAPGGQITAQPRVLDAGGNVIADPAHSLTLAVTPKLSTGNPAMVNGLTVSFPKLIKKLLNQDGEADPNGEFSDGDPTDSNYGKETGGLYTLTATLQGTEIQGKADVTVLPSGTAGITLKVKDFAQQLSNVLTEAQRAAADKNFSNIGISKLQLAAVQATREFDPKVLAANNVLAPPNGFPFTLSQVAAKFPAAADDAKFGSSVDAIVVHVRQIRARVEAINPGAVTQADVDALRAAANTYRTLSDNLASLKPGPVGVTQNSAKLNALIRSEIPALLSAITQKAGAMLASLPAEAGLKVQAAATGVAADSIDLDGVLTLFSNLFSIFTDVAGYAKGNIIELAVSLANDLINMALANAVNEASPGGLAVDFVAAGGQFSFACPRWQNTYIEGTGFSQTLENNSVAVIGCIDSYALRNLLTLKPSKDLASGIRLAFKIKSLVSAMGRDQSIASNETPDDLREGLFGGSQMVFQLGWPRVNQGRIPCTGIVIAFNTESGGFHAVNMNMLPACQ